MPMKKKTRMVPWAVSWAFMVIGLTGCADSDLLKAYQADQPRVLAVRIQEPEAEPGDTVDMQLLVGGKDIRQDMDQPVDWFLQDDPPILLGSAPYHQPFATMVPSSALDDSLVWRDLLVSARIQINGRQLWARKYLRITRTPKGCNPQINSVQVRYRDNNELMLKEVYLGEPIALANPGRDVAFSAVTAVLPEGGNERLVFQWQASTSGNSGGKLFVEAEQSKIDQLFPAGRETSESHADVVFCLKGEKGDDPIQYGLYHIYLVVRDNSFAGTTKAEDRFGTNFFYFSLCVGNACAD